MLMVAIVDSFPLFNQMASFNERLLREKLSGLTATQESIETIANWCLFHRKAAHAVVSCWHAYLQRCPQAQKLSMLYLANDILQKSRRKGAEFIEAFWPVMPAALAHAATSSDNPTRSKLRRLVSVWQERLVFGSTSSLQQLHDAIDSAERDPPAASADAPDTSNARTNVPDASSSIPESLAGAVTKVRAAEREHEVTRKAEEAMAEKECSYEWAMSSTSVQDAAADGALKELDAALTEIDGCAKPLLHALKSESEAKAECASALRSITDSFAEQASNLESRLNEVAARQQQLRTQKRAAEQAWNAQMYFAQRMGTAPPTQTSCTSDSTGNDEQAEPMSNGAAPVAYQPKIYGAQMPAVLNEPTIKSDPLQPSTSEGDNTSIQASDEGNQTLRIPGLMFTPTAEAHEAKQRSHNGNENENECEAEVHEGKPSSKRQRSDDHDDKVLDRPTAGEVASANESSDE
jgi:regulator of Ty1 transposition protein 103